ncbi:MAG: alpha-2-macroglobulin [Chloroflexi bacterium]|nr:alpha-2-macroglobulin [Chloroflexota bacterium]
MDIRKIVVAASLTAIMAVAILPGCIQQPEENVDGYAAVVPAAFRSGASQNVQVSLFNGISPASGQVQIALMKDGKELATAASRINGAGTVQIDVPSIPEGTYQFRVSGPGFEKTAEIAVADTSVVFLETDKPIYKPGQTIHIRILTLDPDLRPSTQDVTLEALDAKGIKVFRRSVVTDLYGMATLDLPLSTEPNLGVWKLAAASSKSKAQIDVKVEEYVLPKYEIKADLPREWFLVSEPIKGKITAEYTFGKPVEGTLKIKAIKYVGQWQAYATVNVPISGAAEFTIPAAGYVAGTPSSGGSGNVQLEMTVEEESTGYTEKTTRLLTVAQSETMLQIIPAGTVFKPGLPFSFLLASQRPDGSLVVAKSEIRITYFRKDFTRASTETRKVETTRGKALVEINPPKDAVALTIEAATDGATATRSVEAGYSPSGNFIHVEQVSAGTASVGQRLTFKVYSTNEASNFYYEVVSRGIVAFSDYTRGRDISFVATPTMSPSSKLLVYQVLPNSEVAADYVPFKVSGSLPQNVKVDFSKPEAVPGESVVLNVATEGQARVGIAAVDRSVYILAENRVNLQQVFDELERLYMKPQAELHEVSFLQSVDTRGAKGTFKDAGVIVLSNKTVPDGKQFNNNNFMERGGRGGIMLRDGKAILPGGIEAPAPTQVAVSQPASGAGLAEVQRVRQFFPETWLWQEIVTDANGKGSAKVTVPDSITTWMLRAVAVSRQNGLGIGEAELKAFQPFFVTADLPYSAVRGEEFPVSVAIYNYLDKAQSVQVQLDQAGWFELLDSGAKTIDIKANDIGSATFKIRPTGLGVKEVKISARTKDTADALIKTIIIEPEGIARELVDNVTLSAGRGLKLDTALPRGIVPGSGRAYLALTSNYLTQTMDGLESLLQMPFGCGEQNMIVFAPDVFITKYLRDSGQLKPEIMAKAEKLMITGYQRQLTYRHNDGSFSAFGNQDKEGSIWLTSFVLKSFSQARDIIYIDEAVLDAARKWIVSHQNSDGSFDQVGMVVHQEMMGGARGKPGLTAYIAVALMQGGERAAGVKAAGYLETKLDGIDDPYTMALVSLALEMAGSKKSDDGYARLMKMAKEDENGLHWGSDVMPLEPSPKPAGMIARPMPMPRQVQPANIEATGYALMALLRHGDNMNAGRAAKWLVSKRNAYGGFGSTQDTVVGLEALTQYATVGRSDVDLVVTVTAGGKSRDYRVNRDNFDVLQMIEVPVDSVVQAEVKGKGDAIAQLVRRFSVVDTEKEGDEILKINVRYDSTQVAVDDLVRVTVDINFNPPQPMEAGMTVVDISVPTGFAAVRDSVAAAMKQDARLKRFDIAGRKVIFYIENMMPGDKVHFSFDVKALYPVSARGASSKVYSYYDPDVAGEILGKDMTVVAG